MSNDCINDVSSAGRERLADDSGCEIMNLQVNARGIRLFKAGKCLDSTGKTYLGFSTKLTSVPECIHGASAFATSAGTIGDDARHLFKVIDDMTAVPAQAMLGDQRWRRLPVCAPIFRAISLV